MYSPIVSSLVTSLFLAVVSHFFFYVSFNFVVIILSFHYGHFIITELNSISRYDENLANEFIMSFLDAIGYC